VSKSKSKPVMIDKAGGPVAAPIERAWWSPDHDDEDSVDDMFIKNCDVHLERMDNGFYWLGVYIDGEVVHIDICTPERSRTRIKARPRR
jgi:hypothetical protein